MKKILSCMALAVVTTTMMSCASKKAQVMRGADDTVTVVGIGSDEIQAQEAAIEKANNYCDDKKKEAVFLDQNEDYSGSVPKGTHKTISKLPGVGKVLTSGDDFKVTMKISCR